MLALYVFWLSVALLVYTYVGFTLLLLLRGLVFHKPYRDEDTFPSVSMIIAAYNEADSIESKIANIKTLDYPPDKFEVIMASDGSDDGTNEIIQRFSGDTLRLVPLPRVGKHVALNAAVAEAKGEILVFSDANSIYARDAIQKLTRPFADPSVGGVAGDQRYLKNKIGASNTGETSYWDFDRLLKKMESASGSVISATGAIYAIRRSLFQPVLGGVTDDFYISTRVILQGYRLVFAADAAAFEPTAKSQKKEFGRKVRIMTRGLNAVVQSSALLNPFKYGFYALQLFTHKVLRRLMFIPLMLLVFSNAFLLRAGLFYQTTFVLQVLFYGLALVGWWVEQRGGKLPKLLTIPTYVCAVYWAAALATWNVLRGHRIERWSTHRDLAT